MTNPLQVVAIDLDGTLFTPQHDYDHARFERMVDECLARGIHVVIASGRQYQSMATMFDTAERLAFVGENGSVVVDRNHELVGANVLPHELTEKVLALLDTHSDVVSVPSGPDGAWIQSWAPAELIDFLHTAYEGLTVVDNLHEVDGRISKFALITHANQAERLAQELSQRLGGELLPVTTGHQGMDLIVPGRHKAWGLQMLLDRWGLGFDDVLAFGDSGNDEEMLAAAGLSYAMETAMPAAVAAAKFRAPSNASGGVMTVVEELLGY